MDFYFLCGLVGVILILIAFLVENIFHGPKKKFYYNLLNMFGSIMLFLYAYSTNTVIFMFLNAVWVMIAIYFMVRYIVFD
jgi:hypothetical protein